MIGCIQNPNEKQNDEDKSILFTCTNFVWHLPACGTDGNFNDDKDSGEFVDPIELFIAVSQLPNGTCSVTYGRFIATFKERNNVSQYQLQVVREDNSKGETFYLHYSAAAGPRAARL